MQVILLERVENLGSIGDEVTVRPGFARNFLLPKNKALRATAANRKRFEGMRENIEADNAQARADAEVAAQALDGQSFILLRQAGEAGQLYGSVSARDIADAAAEGGHKVSRSAVVLDKPIKTLGLHAVRVRLHPEVSVSISVNVARSADEAERQLRGENIAAAAMLEERALAEAQAAEIAAGSIANEAPAQD
jgi:large subunit ribosomal protein L9